MTRVSEKTSSVFHYTTGTGVEGILRSQTLHATHYKYSNDASEMKSIIPALRRIAEPGLRRAVAKAYTMNPGRKEIDRQGGVDKTVNDNVESLIAALYKVTFGEGGKHSFFEPYIVSFCSHTTEYESRNGLLSQWRGYGRESGYAIAFATAPLEELMIEETRTYAYDVGHFGDVVYDGDQAAFQKEFPKLIAGIDQVIPALLSKQPDAFNELYSAFVDATSRHKHHGFKEEMEVRLVLSPRDPRLTRILEKEDPKYATAHRDKKNRNVQFKPNMTPYLDAFAGLGRDLPIQKIIVGPHADKLNRSERLKRYLEKTSREIEVTCSETPYV